MEQENNRKVTAKDMKKYRKWLRAAIQLAFFIFLPSAFTASFMGVKYIFTQIGAGNKIELTMFMSYLIVLCAFTMVFGRFFCGFACAFGTLGDAVRACYVYVCKKLKKKPVKLGEKTVRVLGYLKYLVLLTLVIFCYLGIYRNLQGMSPWDVFSMLHARNFNLQNYIPGIVGLVLIVIAMCLEERFFCKFLCPMGAVFSLLPILPFFTLHRDRETCHPKCSACSKICPMHVDLPQETSWDPNGECFQCQKCIEICPNSNVRCGIKKLSGNEMWFTILRALLLAGLLIWLSL